jgi:hypothetical protein
MTDTAASESNGMPTPEALAAGRPQVRAQTGRGGCLGLGGGVVLLGWLIAQACWSAVALPAAWTQVGAVAAGCLAAVLFSSQPQAYTRSPTYRLQTTVPGWRLLPYHWWRALLLLSWLPGVLLVAGASWVQGAVVSGWWASLAGVIGLAVVLLVQNAILMRQPVFLHPQGIQSSLTYFHAWARICRLQVRGPVVAVDLDRPRSHPPYLMILPEPALTEVLAEAKRRGIAIEAGLPAMGVGKAVALAVALGLAALAWFLVGAGWPWPLAAVAIIALAIPIKLVEERMTGVASLTKNQVTVQNLTGVLDQDVFMDRWIERMCQLHPQDQVEVVAPLHFRTRDAGGAWMDHHLDRAYHLYVTEPARLDEILAEFLDSAAEAAALGPVVAERLIPVVRSRPQLEQMQAQLASRATASTEAAPSSGPVWRDLAGELVVLLAEDHPQTIRYCDPGNLADLGLDAATAFARAQANLAHLVPDRPVEGRDGFYGITVPWHAGALLLDDTWLTQARFPVQGDLLVALPSRDLALVTGTGETEGCRLLAEALQQSKEEPDHRSTQVLRRTSTGSWASYVLPVRDGAADASRNCAGGGGP